MLESRDLGGGGLDYWSVLTRDTDCFIRCWPLGAAMSIVPAVIKDAAMDMKVNAFEDYLLLYRGMMLGVPCYIQQRLVKYRIGSGTSTSFNVRKTQLRQGEFGLGAGRLSLEELESRKGQLSEKVYACVKKVIVEHNKDCEDVIACFSANGIREKWRLLHSRNLMLQNTLPKRYLAPLFLLPNKIGDMLINAATSLLWRYRAWKYRNHPLNKNN